MMAIHSVLKARYADKPAGHWVVFQTEIAGVQILAIGYAWSYSSVLYFVSTCSSMFCAKQCYEMHFERQVWSHHNKEDHLTAFFGMCA
jgi:hypothetical protein